MESSYVMVSTSIHWKEKKAFKEMGISYPLERKWLNEIKINYRWIKALNVKNNIFLTSG